MLFISSGLAYLLAIYFPLQRNRRREGFLLAGITAICGGLLFNAVNNKVDSLQILNIAVHQPTTLNPLHALFVSDVSASKIGSGKKDRNEAFQFFKEANKPEKLLVEVEKPIQSEPLNIIIITLESMGAQMLDAFGADFHISPNLDELARENLAFPNYYGTNKYTIIGETAIWCSTIDGDEFGFFNAKATDQGSINCLPSILARHNYATYYFHGYKSKFYTRNRFLPMIGFQELYFFEDQPDELKRVAPKIGWGVSDEYMYNIMLAQLTQIKKPFFASFMALSGHYPFDADWNIEVPYKIDPDATKDEIFLARYKNAMYYQDYALGTFWRKFKASSLYTNTIVVITADHGFPLHRKKALAKVEENERYFKLPLIMYHPKMKEAEYIEQLGSQVDVAPTLLNMLGMSAEAKKMLGKNLLEKVKSPWAIMIQNGEVRVRDEHNFCYPKRKQACKTKECKDSPSSSMLEGLAVQCDRIEGDLLTNGRAVRLDKIGDKGQLVENATELLFYFLEQDYAN